jgi:hypothetical protein
MAMKKYTKAILSSGLVSAIVYAGLMALCDFHKNEPFDFWKTLYNFISFGVFIAILALYNQKKSLKKIMRKTKMMV